MTAIGMHVLLIHLSGTPLYAAEIANSLLKLGNEVDALVAERNVDENYFNEDISISTVGISSNKETLLRSLSPLTYYRLLKEIKTIDPDVIHITQGFFWLNPVLPFLTSYSLVFTDHEPEETNDVTFYDRTQLYTWSKHHMRSVADSIIVHGEYLKSVLMSKKVPEDKLKALDHGTYRYYRQFDSRQDKDKNELNILFFGLIADYKGIDVFGEAIPAIMENCPRATVTIAGGGDIEKYLSDEVVSLDSVRIYDEFIPDNQVGQLFRQADVVVLPYKSGSQSGVLTIAYEYRTPVVVTDVGGLPEVVDNGETGYVVPPNDSDALASSILDVIKYPEKKQQMERKINEKVESELSWDIICEELVEHYNSLLRG
ncbi:glycosyltransferase family 4 protein [Haloferax sulfurifontis]|uniref:Sugar transferase n=1 Tax=Haloferax sulfurifontis TaxID=255616 RepID=A0A830DTI4_9EURY|nr:glycosyltransferase family 4 protein [Haloferax sulfurifontis]GGC48715.1 sugar transferase [Haloferax sulfurifontis]